MPDIDALEETHLFHLDTVDMRLRVRRSVSSTTGWVLPKLTMELSNRGALILRPQRGS